MSELTMWVVYKSPSDHPGFYVARKWIGGRPTLDFLKTKSLAEIHRFMEQRGLVHLAPDPGDDPVILETWL